MPKRLRLSVHVALTLNLPGESTRTRMRFGRGFSSSHIRFELPLMTFNATARARSYGLCGGEVWIHPLAAFLRRAWSRGAFNILEDHRRLRLFTRGASIAGAKTRWRWSLHFTDIAPTFNNSSEGNS